jgi:hypothetical protein
LLLTKDTIAAHIKAHKSTKKERTAGYIHGFDDNNRYYDKLKSIIASYDPDNSIEILKANNILDSHETLLELFNN